MMRLLVAWVPVTLLALLPAADRGCPEDERLTRFFQDYLDREFAARPLEATRLGDHRFDARLDDVSPKARETWRTHYQQTLNNLSSKINKSQLSRDGQIDLEIFEHELRYRLWLLDNQRTFEQDPRVYNEYLSDSVYLLFAQSTLPAAQNVKNAIARLEFLPRIVAAAKASLKNPPRVMVETAIRQNQGAINFYENGIYELAGENKATSSLRPAASRSAALLREYGQFLEKSVLPNATGGWRLGKEKFAAKLPLELNAGLTAEQVLADAEAEFARVQREMYVVARQLHHRTHPGKPLPPDDEAGRRETITRVLEVLNRDHGKGSELLAQAKEFSERIKTFIKSKDILRLPDPDRCRIIEMPEFQRGNSVAYLNPAPPLDPKASSYYAISPPPGHWDARRQESFLQEYNRYLMQLLTIHEAYPGHYVQLEYSNRHPSLIRRVLQSGVFAEGWAVYTEQMLVDQGYGEGDLALRLNQLKWYLRAVANAILDYRMHCSDWTDEQALDLLVRQSYQSEGEAIGKIIRAKQSSCQLSTYFVGRMAFYNLRQKIQREQGEQFDLGRFHEAVLAHGTLPVKYLGELVPRRLKQPR